MQGTKQKQLKETETKRTFKWAIQVCRYTGKPVENGDAGSGMSAGRTSTGREGGVKGGRGGGISKLQVQV